MQKFISVANTDDLLESLKNDHVTAERRAASMKRLIHEEDKLSRELEQLELAFSRLKRGEENVLRIRRLRDRFSPGSEARKKAERLLITVTGTQQLLVRACEDLRCRHLQNGLIALPTKPERSSAQQCHAAGEVESARVAHHTSSISMLPLMESRLNAIEQEGRIPDDKLNGPFKSSCDRRR